MDKEREITSSACHCINLRRAANAVTDHYDRTLRSAGITLNQYSLLCSIQRIAPCSVAELSRQVRLERSTLVRNLKVLYAAGWIHDEANPGNRKSRICLTEAGADKIRAAKPCWQQAQESVEKALGKDALQQLTQALLTLEKLSGQEAACRTFK